MIVVPELGNSFYLDRKGIDEGDDFIVSDFLCEELPAFLKREYEMNPNAKIILGGYSMGGFGAMLHSLNNIDKFSALISISGAFIATEIALGSEFVVSTDKQRKTAFDIFMIKDDDLPVDVLLDDIQRNPEAIIK